MNIIRVKAFPDAKKFHIEETAPQTLRIFVREEAQRNMANTAVLEAVADFYKIPRNKLRLISGHQGQNKMIQIME